MESVGTELSENKKFIQYVLGESADITLREFIIPSLDNCESFFVCIDGLVNSNEIDNTILEALVKYNGTCKDNYSKKQGNNKNENEKVNDHEENKQSEKSNAEEKSSKDDEKGSGEHNSEVGDGSREAEKSADGSSNKPDKCEENSENGQGNDKDSQKSENGSEDDKDSKAEQKTDKVTFLMKQGVLVPSIKASSNWNEILDAVLSGDTALFLEGEGVAIILSTRLFNIRSVTEPTVESEVRASKDAFNESIRTNTSLIRRRIRDYSLRFESMKIGERTKTDVALAYIDNLVDKGVLGELKSRLQRIKVDAILESGYIEEYITDEPYSLFPLIEHTERPDKASAAILEGRIAVLVDNTPFVLLVPTIFWQYIQAVGDYTDNFFLGTFMRILRLIALFLSLTASSFYVMLVAFHQEMLPTALALRVAAGREGVPFPAVMEAIIMELMFEIMREAGLRLPKPVGQAVSIVGTLVIGEAAVNAGIVGPTLVIAIAASGITSFAIPAYNTSFTLRLAKFPLIILSGSFGILGFLAGTIALTMNLLSLRSFGAPFLSPISPYRKLGNKDIFIRVPWWKMGKRPQMTKSENVRRQEENLKPKPPET